MKKIIFVVILGILFCFQLNAQQPNENFYYFENEKIFIQQRTDKILLKTASNADKDEIHALVDNSNFLRPTTDVKLIDSTFNLVILETTGEQKISSEMINFYKTQSGIISVTPLFEYRQSQLGLTDEFIVKLKQTTSYEQLQALVTNNHCDIVKESPFIKNQFVISVPKTAERNALQMSNMFYETGFFEFTEPSFILIDALNSNDQYFPDQWGLKNTGQYGGVSGFDIKAEQAWTITQGSPYIKIAITDDGIDLAHPDLYLNLLPGYNTYGTGVAGSPILPDDAHGTGCAGVMVATKDNGVGISGVAPNCKIIPIRAGQGGWIYYGADAIEWAWRNGADVISNSWGSYAPSTIVKRAIDSAAKHGREGKGCVIVFSTGNDDTSCVQYQSSLSNVIGVGSLSNHGIRADFSNYGTGLDVLAPGAYNIWSTDRLGYAGFSKIQGYANDYSDYFHGTSISGPFVAGVAALILSVNPDLTAAQVRSIINATAMEVPGYNFNTQTPDGLWNEEVGYGLVDAYAAVQKAVCTITTENFTNQIITTDTTVTSCGDINVENVKVQNGAKLTLDAEGEVNIGVGFEVELGSEFEIVN